MSAKTDTEVIIGGKVFTLSGYESEAYLQRVASYINNKMAEYSKVDSFRRQPVDTQNVLLQLNIADDYFKAKKQISILEEDIQGKEKELYDLKHELITAQIKLENVEKNVKGLQDEMSNTTRKMIHMEAELSERNRRDVSAETAKETPVEIPKETFTKQNQAGTVKKAVRVDVKAGEDAGK